MTLGAKIAVGLVLIGGIADLTIFVTLGHTQTISHELFVQGAAHPWVIVLWFLIAFLLALHFWGWRRVVRFLFPFSRSQ